MFPILGCSELRIFELFLNSLLQNFLSLSFCFLLNSTGSIFVLCLIVTRVAVNQFGPTGGEHIGLALRELTGLHELDLSGTCLHDSGCCGAWGVG